MHNIRVHPICPHHHRISTQHSLHQLLLFFFIPFSADEEEIHVKVSLLIYACWNFSPNIEWLSFFYRAVLSRVRTLTQGDLSVYSHADFVFWWWPTCTSGSNFPQCLQFHSYSVKCLLETNCVLPPVAFGNSF